MKKVENDSKVKIKGSAIKILFGSGISFLISLVLLLAISIVLTYTNISENIITVSVIVISALSILIGSIISALNINKNGISIFISTSVKADIEETAIPVTLSCKPNVSITVTGKPMAPKAPAEAFAIKHNMAACNGANPNCVSNKAQIAIGTPNPAAPSKNPLNANPINSN